MLWQWLQPLNPCLQKWVFATFLFIHVYTPYTGHPLNKALTTKHFVQGGTHLPPKQIVKGQTERQRRWPFGLLQNFKLWLRIRVCSWSLCFCDSLFLCMCACVHTCTTLHWWAPIRPKQPYCCLHFSTVLLIYSRFCVMMGQLLSDSAAAEFINNLYPGRFDP